MRPGCFGSGSKRSSEVAGGACTRGSWRGAAPSLPQQMPTARSSNRVPSPPFARAPSEARRSLTPAVQSIVSASSVVDVGRRGGMVGSRVRAPRRANRFDRRRNGDRARSRRRACLTRSATWTPRRHRPFRSRVVPRGCRAPRAEGGRTTRRRAPFTFVRGHLQRRDPGPGGVMGISTSSGPGTGSTASSSAASAARRHFAGASGRMTGWRPGTGRICCSAPLT